MSLKSRSTIYDRLEKLVYDFAAIQDEDETGLNGKEPIEIIAARFTKWLTGKAILKAETVGSPRVGKVFAKDC
jgi:hypothetical protein